MELEFAIPQLNPLLGRPLPPTDCISSYSDAPLSPALAAPSRIGMSVREPPPVKGAATTIVPNPATMPKISSNSRSPFPLVQLVQIGARFQAVSPSELGLEASRPCMPPAQPEMHANAIPNRTRSTYRHGLYPSLKPHSVQVWLVPLP